MSIEQEAELVERPSKITFGPTLERLVNAIEAAGMLVFAKIDHSAGAREINAAMPPTVVLIYGHPRGGTPIILAEPRAALDLPLRVLVREDTEGKTPVSFHPIGPILRQASVPGELSAALGPARLCEPWGRWMVIATVPGRAPTESGAHAFDRGWDGPTSYDGLSKVGCTLTAKHVGVHRWNAFLIPRAVKLFF